MVVLFVLGVLVLGGIVLALLTRGLPTYRSDALRELDPRLKEQIDGQFMRGDGGHHKEDFEYGGDKSEWE